MTNHSQGTCTNCSSLLEGKDVYCPQCGQRIQNPRLSIRELIHEASVALFGYDQQVWRTLKFLPIPGRLPQMYRNGQRKSLVHPVRLFILIFIGLALLLQVSISDGDEGFHATINVDLPSATPNLQDSMAVDSNILFEAKTNFDSTHLIIFDAEGWGLETQKVPSEWLDNYSPSAIADSLDVMGFLPRTVLSKHIKLIKGNESFSSFLVRTLVWMLLILQPVIAFWLFLPKYRNSYYSDHLILTMYTHSSVFAFVLMYLIGVQLMNSGGENQTFVLFSLIYYLGIGIFIYFGLKRFYQMSRFKTILYWLYISLMYGLSFVTIFAMNLIISFLLF